MKKFFEPFSDFAALTSIIIQTTIQKILFRSPYRLIPAPWELYRHRIILRTCYVRRARCSRKSRPAMRQARTNRPTKRKPQQNQLEVGHALWRKWNIYRVTEMKPKKATELMISHWKSGQRLCHVLQGGSPRCYECRICRNSLSYWCCKEESAPDHR